MLITLFIAFIKLFAPDQPKWDELSAFEIYSRVDVSALHQINDAYIQKLPSKSANISEAKKLLTTAKIKIGPILWKGAGRLAIAKFKDGSSRKILINTYGSSFRDITGSQDYIVENADAWRKFVAKNIPKEPGDE